jgi:hypothetical protein
MTKRPFNVRTPLTDDGLVAEGIEDAIDPGCVPSRDSDPGYFDAIRGFPVRTVDDSNDLQRTPPTASSRTLHFFIRTTLLQLV